MGITSEIGEGKSKQPRRQDRQCDRKVAPGEFLGNQNTGHRGTLASAALRFGQGIGHETEFMGGFDHILGRGARFIGFAAYRPDFIFCELVDGLDDEGLFFSRLVIDHFRNSWSCRLRSRRERMSLST